MRCRMFSAVGNRSRSTSGHCSGEAERWDKAAVGQTATQWPQSMHSSSARSAGTGIGSSRAVLIMPKGHSAAHIPSRRHLLASTLKRVMFQRLANPGESLAIVHNIISERPEKNPPSGPGLDRGRLILDKKGGSQQAANKGLMSGCCFLIPVRNL